MLKRDVCIAVELTVRPTIRVVSPLYSTRTKGLRVSQWGSTDVMVKPDKRVSETGWIWWSKLMADKFCPTIFWIYSSFASFYTSSDSLTPLPSLSVTLLISEEIVAKNWVSLPRATSKWSSNPFIPFSSFLVGFRLLFIDPSQCFDAAHHVVNWYICKLRA